MAGEVPPLADAPPAAHHFDMRASVRAVAKNADIIGVGARLVFGEVTLAHGGEGADFVAQQGRLFESLRARVGLHLRLQFGFDLAAAAAQKTARARGVGGVSGGRDFVHARRAATVDLVQQARARAVGESAVGASAQAKRALQRIDAFAHRARIGKRPEAIRAFRAAIKMQPRIRMRRQAQERIRFVVAEQNIKPRPQFLDEIVFDKQRFGGAGGGDDFDFEREREHRRSARRGIFLAQMRENAIAQIGGFADIQRAPFAVDKAIHARRTRQPHRRFDGNPRPRFF